MDKRSLGRNGPNVTRLGFGSGPIGNDPNVTVETAVATIHKALDLGVNYIDTAPVYGAGRAEEIVGKALSGINREDYVISTKVGMLVTPGAPAKDLCPDGIVNGYSKEEVTRSLKISMDRLGIENPDVLLVHDPDYFYQQALDESYPALKEMKAQGRIKAIGAGMMQWEMEYKFAKEGDSDCFLLAGPYNIMSQGGTEGFLDYCAENGIDIIIGMAYRYLPTTPQIYDTNVTPTEMQKKANTLLSVCERHHVPVRAAALQFVLAHPAIATVLTGARKPSEIEDNVAMINHSISSSFWKDLKQEEVLSEESITPD